MNKLWPLKDQQISNQQDKRYVIVHLISPTILHSPHIQDRYFDIRGLQDDVSFAEVKIHDPKRRQQDPQGIKLLDENNKLVSVYPASQTRKKAYNMKKDITLVNSSSYAVICRFFSFRNDILNNFFDEIVYKHNKTLFNRANASMELKIALNLNHNELKIKAKKIIKLSNKNLNVKVVMNCKQETIDESLEKIQFLNSEIQRKCIIDTDIRNYREQEPQEGKFHIPKHIHSLASQEKMNSQKSSRNHQRKPQAKPFQTFQENIKSKTMLTCWISRLHRFHDKPLLITLLIFLSVIFREKSIRLQLKLTVEQKIKEFRRINRPVLTVLQRDVKARILNERLKVFLGWNA